MLPFLSSLTSCWIISPELTCPERQTSGPRWFLPYPWSASLGCLWAFYALEVSTASLMGRKQEEVQEIPGTSLGKSALWNFLAMRPRFVQCQVSKKKLQWRQPLRGPFPPVSPWRDLVPEKGRRWYFGLPLHTAFWLPNPLSPPPRICFLLLSLTSLHIHITCGLHILDHLIRQCYHPRWSYPTALLHLITSNDAFSMEPFLLLPEPRVAGSSAHRTLYFFPCLHTVL